MMQPWSGQSPAPGLSCRVWDLGFRVSGLDFRAEMSGFGVPG